MILSSHILSEVRSVCDQILIISKGHLVAGDTPENLEKLFAGNTTIELTARAEDGEIREMLSFVSGIRTISCSAPRPGRNGEPETEVSIETDGNVDIREELFDAFAAGGTFVVLLLDYLSPSLADFLPAGGSIVSALCLFTPLENFLYGIFDIKGIVLYLSTIILFLFLTVRALEKRRWS